MRHLFVIAILSIFNSLCDGDKEIFEISSYNEYNDDESEHEIIRATDFFSPQILERDENKYKSLHSYVKQLNQHIAETKIQIPNVLYHSQSDKRKIFNVLPEIKPHTAGFMYKLNKYYLEISTEGNANATKKKRNILKYNKLNYNSEFEDYVNFVEMKASSNYQEEDPLPLLIINKEDINKYIQLNSAPNVVSTLESANEDTYDYDTLKMNYQQQVEKDKDVNDTLNHKQDIQNEKLHESVSNVNDTMNCTKKYMDYFTIKTIKCLLHNYTYTKDKTEANKKLLSNIWLIIKIWLCIYICIAIPCWCQRGWCCCCFRCKICFPHKRIILAKQYYTRNPPGILMRKLGKKKSIKYEPSGIEQDLYEQLETAIRNI